jgi:signal transduction histidine kinase
VARESVQAAQTLPGAPPIRFSAANRTVRVRADAGRLGQVLLNLLGNAIEHAPRSASIDVTVRRAGRTAELEVVDHGDGIPADRLPRLFEAYGRLGQSRRTGLGLGLYLAREIVTAHGGQIDVSSIPGEGVTVTVRLPLGRTSARGRRNPPAATT